MNITIPKGNEYREQIARNVAQAVQRLDAKKAWLVTIAEKKGARTEQQNRYLWGVCYAELVKHLPGWHADDVHEYMLGEWSGWETLEGMGRKRLRPLRRSSKLNKAEFADFVAFIQQRAAQHGVVIPDPNYESHQTRS